jgi:predicted secreted protein
MIQFKRGTTKSWRGTKTKLAPGQPGYDKDKHKIKIGDGAKTWSELPYVSGLTAEEILDAETAAKSKQKLDAEDTTIITYGTETPDKNTIGKIYLQQYDTEPEADYVVEAGTNGIWTYQKWKSGIAKCCGTYSLTTSLQESFENSELHYSSGMKSTVYPFTFKNVPTETATLQSPGGITWIASKTKNTNKTSGIYVIISQDAQLTNASYNISIQVEGLWR